MEIRSTNNGIFGPKYVAKQSRASSLYVLYQDIQMRMTLRAYLYFCRVVSCSCTLSVVAKDVDLQTQRCSDIDTTQHTENSELPRTNYYSQKAIKLCSYAEYPTTHSANSRRNRSSLFDGKSIAKSIALVYSSQSQIPLPFSTMIMIIMSDHEQHRTSLPRGRTAN